ncbi:MAG: hypothetical protein QM765_43320 [Myxococcales bacterium]
MALRPAEKLEYAADQDWFSFAASAGHLYQITLSSTGWVDCDVLDVPSSQNPLASLTSYGYGPADSALAWTAAQGTHYLRIQRTSYASTPAPTYSVLVEDLGPDDYGDDSTVAAPVTVGSTAKGVLGYAGDKDWFTFGATPGHIYEVSVAASAPVTMTLYRSPSISLGSKSFSISSIVQELTSTGPYYVSVAWASSSTSPITYDFKVTDYGLDDFGSSASKAKPLNVGQAITGKTQYPGDTDWFSVVTVPGRLYKAEASVASGNGATVDVYAPNGATRLEQGLQGKSTLFGAGDAGPYFVVVRADLGVPYTLTVSEAGTDDHGNSAAMATPLVLGAPSYGILEYAADQDWFAAGLEAQHIYRLEFAGDLATVQVLNGATPVASPSSSPTLFKAAVGGTYHVAVRVRGSSTGAYSLVLTDLGPDDHGEGTAGATPLTLATSLSGSIQFSRDVDWMSLATEVGRIYRVTVSPVGFAAEVQVLGSNGATGLASAYSYTPMVVGFLAPETGVAYVSLASLFSGGLGIYTVVAEDAGIDDAGNTQALAAALTIGGGPQAGAIQYSGDVDVYSFQAAPGTRTLRLTIQGPLATSWQVGTTSITIGSGTGPGTASLSLPYTGPWYLTVRPATSGQIGQYSVEVAP